MQKSDFKKLFLIIGIIILIFCSIFYYTYIYYSVLPTILRWPLDDISSQFSEYLYIITPGIIPLIIAYILIKKIRFPRSILNKKVDKKAGIRPLPMLILSFVCFSFFSIGYDLYIHYFLSGKEAIDRLEESLVNISDITTYLLMNSLPYFIFFILGLFSMFIFIKNNKDSKNYIYGIILCILFPLFFMDWKYLFIFIILGFYFLYAYVIQTEQLTEKLISIKTPFANQEFKNIKIGSNQLNNFLQFIAFLTFLMGVIFFFGKLSFESRNAILLSFYQKEPYTILTNLNYQFFVNSGLYKAINLLAVSILINGIFLFVYIYFQRSIGYLFAIVAAFTLLTDSGIIYSIFIVNFIMCFLVIGIFMYIALFIIQMKLKEKTTKFIKTKFDKVRKSNESIFFIEYPLVGFPYAILSILFISHYYALMEMTFIILFQLIITLLVMYFYLYKQYLQGKVFFDYDIF